MPNWTTPQAFSGVSLFPTGDDSYPQTNDGPPSDAKASSEDRQGHRQREDREGVAVPGPPDEGMSAGAIRSTWRRFTGTRDLLLRMHEAGWVIVSETKHYRAFCPCPEAPMNFQVSGSPRSDHTTLRRLRSQMRKCPDQHEVVQQRAGKAPRR